MSWRRVIIDFSERCTLAVARAKQELARIDRRHTDLGGALFGDPAWTVLLSAFVLHHETSAITGDHLAIQARLHPSLSGRYIRALAHDGWLTQSISPNINEIPQHNMTAAGVSQLTNLLLADGE